jgi:hypothetical protein
MSLKDTLDEIIDDDSDGYEASADYHDYCEVKGMEDAHEDDQEYGGPGLASEVSEGSAIPVGTIHEGYTQRYIARKFGLRLDVTEEALEDNKYDKTIRAASRLKRIAYKSIDIDAANLLGRATNSSYVGGDGVSLASTSHTLPDGSTWSNMFATAVTPSRIAIQTGWAQVRKYPGHDGITEGYGLKRILCPIEQEQGWIGITDSEKAPEPGAFNEINTVRRMKLEVKGLRHWSNTTTAWAIQTDCENGLQIRFRRKPRSRSWVENSNEIMSYSISYRLSRGWSDARNILFSNA